MQHKIVAQRLIFSNCPESESSKEKLRCDRVFMENMNEGSMQLLCLLISPQGWGTLRLYSFTTTDGLLRDVHCASLGWVCVYVCGWGDQTHSCLLKRSPWISSHESGCQTSSHTILFTNYILDKYWKVHASVHICTCVKLHAFGVHHCKWIGIWQAVQWAATMATITLKFCHVHIKKMSCSCVCVCEVLCERAP